MKFLKAAVLVLVMAPLVALATPRDLAMKVIVSSPVAHDEGATVNPTPAPSAAPAPAASVTPATTGPVATTTTSSSATAEAKDKTGLSVAIDLDHWLGTGTFIDPKLYSYLAANLSITPRYAFKVNGVKLAVSLSGRLTYEYTLPDNSNGRRFAPWDTRLGLSAPSLIKNEFTGISVSPSFGLVIPTTLESWHAGLITSLSVGAAVAKSAGRFDFLLTGSGARAFHTNPMNAVRAQNAQEQAATRSIAGELTVLSRAGETLSDSSGMNTAWTASVGGSIKLRVTEELSFAVAYSYLHYWKYRIPDDQYTCTTLTSTGGRACTSDGQIDRTFGVISADYSLSDHYGISLSASTIQTPKSGANGAAGTFRFPFFAVNNGPTNATSINFTFSASY